jgi:aminopeptidase N
VHPVGQVMTAFWRPGQDALLAPYTQRYLEVIPELDQGGMILAMVFTRCLFAPFAIDDAYIETARQAAEKAAPVVRKTLLERSDIVRRMLRSRTGATA